MALMIAKIGTLGAYGGQGFPVPEVSNVVEA
jgi:hypothetical protein